MPPIVSFLGRRLAWSVITLWFVVTLAFLMAYALPADPTKVLLGPHPSPQQIAKLKKQLCLDRSLLAQYGCFVGRIARGDLGKSFNAKEPVAKIIAKRIGMTAKLAVSAVFLMVLIGVPLGVWAALRRNQMADTAITTGGLLGMSTPTFFGGLLLLYVFGFQLGWFPIGYQKGHELASLVLPAFTMAITGIAVYSRIVRGEMIEIMQEDYIRTAQAKGLSRRAVVVKHALRNALTPVVTMIGLDLGALLGGAIITEYLFQWPGLGREAVKSIITLDRPLILGTVLVASAFIVVANLVVDVLYAALDPRVRLE
ncbi:MAG: ABC transporter permease [Deltaproteobacteria bacterium]|nr:ABC transporter permease [Deltaproteobacteria bacterium]